MCVCVCVCVYVCVCVCVCVRVCGSVTNCDSTPTPHAKRPAHSTCSLKRLLSVPQRHCHSGRNLTLKRVVARTLPAHSSSVLERFLSGAKGPRRGSRHCMFQPLHQLATVVECHHNDMTGWLVKPVSHRVVPEEVRAGTEIPGGGGRGRLYLYLTLHCHHQNDSTRLGCMGSHETFH